MDQVNKKERVGETIDLPSGRVAVMEECRGSDQAALSNKKLSKFGKAFDVILLRRLISLDGNSPVKQEDLDGLVIGDFDFLMIKLRQSLHGDIIPLKLTCEACKEESDWEIDLNDVPITSYPEQTEFLFDTPRGHKIVIRNAYHRDTKKLIRKNDPNLSEVLLVRIKTIDDIPATLKTLEDLPATDYNFIRKKLDEHSYGPDTVVKFKCPECGQELITRLEMETVFFFPNMT